MFRFFYFLKKRQNRRDGSLLIWRAGTRMSILAFSVFTFLKFLRLKNVRKSIHRRQGRKRDGRLSLGPDCASLKLKPCRPRRPLPGRPRVTGMCPQRQKSAGRQMHVNPCENNNKSLFLNNNERLLESSLGGPGPRRAAARAPVTGAWPCSGQTARRPRCRVRTSRRGAPRALGPDCRPVTTEASFPTRGRLEAQVLNLTHRD